MKYEHNDIKITYEKFGIGKKNIIILPGWGETKKTFQNMIEFLKDNNTIYLIDYPGFGKNDFPDKDLTIYDYADLINSFITEKKIIKPILIGHSFGGRLIILLNSYLNNDYNSIIIDGAGIKPKKNIRRWLKIYLYKLLKALAKFKKQDRDKYLNKIQHLFGSADYNNLPEKMKKTFINIVKTDLTKYLKIIDSNILLIWGEDDFDTPLRDGKLMYKLIKKAELIVIKKAGHFCYLNEPYLINNIILAFIKGV